MTSKTRANPRPEQRPCPKCGTPNPPANKICSACGTSLAKPGVTGKKPPASLVTRVSSIRPWMLLPIVAILMMICVVVGYLFFRTPSVIGVVQKTEWQRAIVIEAQNEVTGQDWRDQLPGEAKILACQPKYRSHQDTPTAGATEVCATQPTDQSNAVATPGKTCYYEVYADYCNYQSLVWQTVDRALAQGSDLKPYWPQVNPANNQRTGARTETYTTYFETKDGVKQFTTSNAALFLQLLPDTEWLLSLDKLGNVVDVFPPG